MNRSPTSKKTVNPLLVPIELGKSRPGLRDLPPADHAYGLKNDMEGIKAKDVLGSWIIHEPNAAAVPGRDFRALNRNALLSGMGLTAHQISEYRKTHDVRLKGGHELQKAHSHGSGTVQQHKIFGQPSGERISMDAIMTNKFHHDFELEQARRVSEYKNVVTKIPIMHTKASLGHRHVELREADKEETPFKLKRFANVEPRVRF